MAGRPGRVYGVVHGHEFATEWARYVTRRRCRRPFALTVQLRQEHYPFWAPADLELHAVELFGSAGEDLSVTVAGEPATLRRGELTTQLPPAVGPLNMQLDDNSITDRWLALYRGAEQ